MSTILRYAQIKKNDVIAHWPPSIGRLGTWTLSAAARKLGLAGAVVLRARAHRAVDREPSSRARCNQLWLHPLTPIIGPQRRAFAVNCRGQLSTDEKGWERPHLVHRGRAVKVFPWFSPEISYVKFRNLASYVRRSCWTLSQPSIRPDSITQQLTGNKRAGNGCWHNRMLSAAVRHEVVLDLVCASVCVLMFCEADGMVVSNGGKVNPQLLVEKGPAVSGHGLDV